MLGISMIVVWEHDYKEDKNKIINELREKNFMKKKLDNLTFFVYICNNGID